MKHYKQVLIFGATGFIGRYLIRLLTKNNYRVRAITRNTHSQGALRLKTQSNYGFFELKEVKNLFDIENLKPLFNDVDICINLIGILYEKRNNSFKNIHVNFPSILAKLSNEFNLEQFLQVSALNIEESSIDSIYAKSKLEGEEVVKQNFKEASIIRPSIVYGKDDVNFTNLFMKLLSNFPIFPLYYNGKSQFSLIHVRDLAKFIFYIIDKNIKCETFEAVGFQTFSFKEIILKLIKSLEISRLLISLPYPLAKFSSRLIETIMSKPLITIDQLKLLKYDFIKSNKYRTNLDFGIGANTKFEDEIENWSYLYKSGGEYSRKK